jgi:GNAT superfamily N-acetyltransferase
MTLIAESVSTWSDRDVEDIAGLVATLGYAVTGASMRSRLERIVPEAGHRTWIVRGEDGSVVAIAGAQITWAYNSDEPSAQLLLLVVNSSVRRAGTGSSLLETFERWASEQGAHRLSAVSAAATDSAHRFYQKRGYHEAGLRYTKLA